MHSHGVTSSSPVSQQTAHRPEANAEKERVFRACMQQTLAEGKRSDADCDGATPPSEPATGESQSCRAEALQIIARCEGTYSSANNSCASSRVDSVVQQAQAANQQKLNQSGGSYSQACGGTAQAYQDAVTQLGTVQSSCRAAVSQCSTECERAQEEIQRCSDPAVAAKASAVSSALHSCSSGTLARRPTEIARASDSLRQGAEGANNCAQDVGSSGGGTPGSASSGGGVGNGKVNSSSGVLDPNAGGLTDQSDLSGTGRGPTGGAFNRGDSGSANLRGSGGSGIAEAYNVSGKSRDSANGGDIMAANAALAALPGTPSQVDNGEKTEAQSEKGSVTAAGTGDGGAGGGGSGHRLMMLPRQAAVLGSTKNIGTRNATGGPDGESGPDLSAFLPHQRGVAGGVIAGLAGCRIPDPANPKQCAVPHGPSANIWSEVKERFEILRKAQPPTEYFFNED